MGEYPQKALANASLHPADLSEEDSVTLDAVYSHVVHGWGSQFISSEILGLDLKWRSTVRHEARIYFSSDPGRRWLKVRTAGAEDFVAEAFELAEETVKDESVNHFGSNYTLLLAND